MNLENFAEYLKYPSRLYQLPYEELKSLTLQYPYCTSFHVLLLIKSKQENHPDLEKNLAKAATYSLDRKLLQKIMQEDYFQRIESQLTIGADEILELKDLVSLDAELEKIPVSKIEANRETTPANALGFDLVPDAPEPPDEEFLLPSEEIVGEENSENDLQSLSPSESFAEKTEPISPPPLPGAEDVVDIEIGIPDAASEPFAFLPDPAILYHSSTALSIVNTTLPAELPPPEPSKTVPPVELAPSLAPHCATISRVLDDWHLQREQIEIIEWEVQPTKAKEEVEVKEKVEAAVETAPKVVTEVGKPLSRPSPSPTPKSKFKSFRKRYHRPSFGKVHPKPAPGVSDHQEKGGARKVADESVREDLGIASETLAGLLVKQQQYDRAIKMYEHLSLLIPEKNAYFAAKIDAIKNY